MFDSSTKVVSHLKIKLKFLILKYKLKHTQHCGWTSKTIQWQLMTNIPYSTKKCTAFIFAISLVYSDLSTNDQRIKYITSRELRCRCVWQNCAVDSNISYAFPRTPVLPCRIRSFYVKPYDRNQGNLPENFTSSYLAFQGHSRSLEPTQIDWSPVASY